MDPGLSVAYASHETSMSDPGPLRRVHDYAGFMTKDVSKHYDARFYEAYGGRSRKSASVVVPIVNDIVRPESVLDVGCGVGSWLAEWIRQGLTDVLGLDGEHVNPAAMQVETARFRKMDLQDGFSLGRTFDLVQSLEVAEHLDESCADLFVDSLTRHGDTVLFSAAIPGQRGAHHVNEQWPSYWTAKFARAGFKLFDVVRPEIWTDRRVDIWYRQNTLLFSKALSFDTPNTYLDVVHPEIWGQRQDASSFQLRDLVRGMPAATAAAVRFYGGRAAAKLGGR
jgi:2-polyprenyl-3-methyl-5-hydroxy-6-metoxy-1,4-benzoquinol methylase